MKLQMDTQYWWKEWQMCMERARKYAPLTAGRILWDRLAVIAKGKYVESLALESRNKGNA